MCIVWYVVLVLKVICYISRSDVFCRYNRQGRAVPDISLLGQGYQIIAGGIIGYSQVVIEGTSASAPAAAGLISLLNEARAQKGCGPLGFLNPLFYQHPEMFNDITIGNNR